MNTKIPFLALCVVLATPGFAAEKKSKKKSGSTLPPTSPMLMVSAPPANTVDAMDASGLITTKLSGRDLDFFETLMKTGQLQVILGDLVKTKAESPQVKSVGMTLASTLVDENQQINRLATLNGLTLSAAAAGEQRQTSAELEKLSGTSFDIACVSKIVEANRQTVRAYEEGSESTNPDIQTFAEQMLPIAKKRLWIAEKMIEGSDKPASALPTPAPRMAPVELRPGSPSPGKKPGATPLPLTLGSPKPVPFPTPLPALPTPPPITSDPAMHKAQPAPAAADGAPASIPPTPDAGAAPAPGTKKSGDSQP